MIVCVKCLAPKTNTKMQQKFCFSAIDVLKRINIKMECLSFFFFFPCVDRKRRTHLFSAVTQWSIESVNNATEQLALRVSLSPGGIWHLRQWEKSIRDISVIISSSCVRLTVARRTLSFLVMTAEVCALWWQKNCHGEAGVPCHGVHLHNVTPVHVE